MTKNTAKDKEENGFRPPQKGLVRRAGRTLYAIPATLGGAAVYVGMGIRKVAMSPTERVYSSNLYAIPVNAPVTFTSPQFGTCTLDNLGNGNWSEIGSGGTQFVHQAANGLISGGGAGSACPDIGFKDIGNTLNGNPIIQPFGVISGHLYQYVDPVIAVFVGALAVSAIVTALVIRRKRENVIIEKYMRGEMDKDEEAD